MEKRTGVSRDDFRVAATRGFAGQREVIDCLNRLDDRGETREIFEKLNNGCPGVMRRIGPHDGRDSNAGSEAADDSSDGEQVVSLTRPGVVEKLERLRGQGDEYRTQAHYASLFGCSVGLINRAIHSESSLQQWARRDKAAKPNAVSLNEIILENAHQSTEPDPSEEAEERDEAEAAMRLLIEQASSPDERARILEMTDEQRREIAGLAINDPDRGYRVQNRKA